MQSPEITVYSFSHPRSSHFTLYTLDEEHGYAFYKDESPDEVVKKIIYTGPIPRDMRILPKVEDKYLKNYMSFRSQYIQKKYRKDPIMMGVISATRGECWSSIYDGETYDEDGIITNSLPRQLPKEVTKFLQSLLSKEDKARIAETQRKFWEDDDEN